MPRKPAPATRIKNTGSGHSYLLDGTRAPGVTTILGDGIPKPALQGWAAGVVAEYVVERLRLRPDGTIDATELVAEALAWNQTRNRPTQVSPGPLPRNGLVQILKDLRYKDRDDAARRGTEVHGLAELLAEGKEVDVPDELAGHVRSYLRFLEAWQPYDALLEGVIVNRRFRYMGKFDLLAKFDRIPPELRHYLLAGEHDPPYTGLLDVKTSRSGIFAETALQLEGYRRGETIVDPDGTEVPMPSVDFVAAIHVRADDYDVFAFDIETEQRPTTFDVFLYSKMIGEWLNMDEGAAATIRSDSLRFR